MDDVTGCPGAGSDEEACGASPMSAEEMLGALESHAVRAARRAREKLAGPLGAGNFGIFLQAEECLRYPTVLQFDGTGLDHHQFAEPELITTDDRKTCILHVREHYEREPEMHRYIVAYMACSINYGTAATPHMCELYGSTLLDMPIDAFYDAVCRVADHRAPEEPGPGEPEP